MIGTLNDKGMNDAGVMVARIDEKPYEVLSYVLPFLEKLEKGLQVEVTLNKDHKISKISRAKGQQRNPSTQVAMDKAGFGPETKQEERKDCTSSITPAANPSNSTGLKTVEGQITAINYEKRGIAIKDKVGNTHPFYWSETFKMVNYKGEPLQQWWFVRITAELQKSDDTWWVTAQEYFKKPDDWPRSQGKGGGGRHSAEENRLIVFQCTYKECCETVRQQMMAIGQEFDEAEYNRVMDIAVARAIKDGKALIEAGGA